MRKNIVYFFYFIVLACAGTGVIPNSTPYSDPLLVILNSNTIQRKISSVSEQLPYLTHVPQTEKMIFMTEIIHFHLDYFLNQLPVQKLALLFHSSKSGSSCVLCKWFFSAVKDLLSDPLYSDSLKKFILTYLGLMLFPKGTDANPPEKQQILEIMLENEVYPYVKIVLQQIDKKKLCAYDLQMCSTPHYDEPLALDFSYLKPKEFPQNTDIDFENARKDPNHFNALLISDLHIDLKYKENTSINCNFLNAAMPCCRTEGISRGNKGIKDTPAGVFGEYTCNANLKILESMREFIQQENIQFDAIFWLGDTVGHSLWSISENSIKNDIMRVSDIIFKISQEHNVPVFPVIGNHDVFPSNAQDFSKPMNPQLVQFGKIWKPFLGDAYDKFIQYGYYSKNWKNNIKIIALNTNEYYERNPYMIQSHIPDLSKQLKFLETELEEAKSENKKVILISHSCSSLLSLDFSITLRALAEKHNKIISVHFCGHAHEDTFHIIKSTRNKIPLITQLSIGQLSTFGRTNPQFALSTFSSSTSLLQDVTKYYFPIEEANSHPQQSPNSKLPAQITTKWKTEGSFKEYFKLHNMSAKYLNKILQDIRFKEKAALRLIRYKSGFSGGFGEKECDTMCRTRLYCESAFSIYKQIQLCEKENGVEEIEVELFFNRFRSKLAGRSLSVIT